MFSKYLIFSSLVLVTWVAAANSNTQVNLTQIISEIPSCALGCVYSELSSSWCNLSDPTCLCRNQTLQAELSVCVQEACTLAELVPLARANNALCEGFRVESRGWEVVTVGVSLISITLPLVFLRCISRYLIVRQLWWDDWAILVAAMSLAGIIVTDVLDAQLGLGEHLWDVQASNNIPLLKIFMVAEVLYMLAVIFTKASILLFYLRVFRRPFFRKVVKVNIGFVLASGAAFVLVIIFQCNPVRGTWDKTVPATCVDANALAYAASGIAIAQDLLILFLPIPELATLQMTTRKKWNVMGMFSIGGFACVTSIVRVKFIVTFGNSKDPSWDNVTPSIWSLIEINVAMVCACLPAIRALLGRWLPSIFGMSSKVHTTTIAELQSQSNHWSGRRAGHNGKIPSAIGDKDAHIITTREIDESMRKTANQKTVNSGYSGTRNSIHDLDEYDFLDVRMAIPLRTMRDNHIATQMTVNNSSFFNL